MSTRSPRHNNNSSSRASILFLGGIALFAAGCGLGHWHGRILLSNTNNERWSGGNGGMEAWSTSSIHRRLDHNDTTISKQNKCLGDTKDGWHTIHVFYGMTDPIDDNEEETATSTTAGSSTPAVQEERLLLQDETYPTTVSTISIHATQRHRRRWFSQARQDEIVFALLRNKTQGYFVDLAANDAVQFSNTVALETFHNWTGVCIEPNPIYWPRLASLRTNCITIAAVVGAERMQEVYFRFEAGDHGGISDNGFDNGKRWQSSSQRRYTVPLLEILKDRARAPIDIDYLSLDVEGAETFIMQNFPFDAYQIKIITAERLRGPIREVLKSHGFQFVTRLTKWGESLWVHYSVRDELDWSAMEKFNFPII